ncbi:MAG: hypothetical protein GYB68_18910 [Chloroflexi bacterium]|nr:hypothetical protein [Chloroflexota bacterium]
MLVAKLTQTTLTEARLDLLGTTLASAGMWAGATLAALLVSAIGGMPICLGLILLTIPLILLIVPIGFALVAYLQTVNQDQQGFLQMIQLTPFGEDEQQQAFTAAMTIRLRTPLAIFLGIVISGVASPFVAFAAFALIMSTQQQILPLSANQVLASVLVCIYNPLLFGLFALRMLRNALKLGIKQGLARPERRDRALLGTLLLSGGRQILNNLGLYAFAYFGNLFLFAASRMLTLWLE